MVQVIYINQFGGFMICIYPWASCCWSINAEETYTSWLIPSHVPVMNLVIYVGYKTFCVCVCVCGRGGSPCLLFRIFDILLWPMLCKDSTTIFFVISTSPAMAASRFNPSLSKCSASTIFRILSSSSDSGFWISAERIILDLFTTIAEDFITIIYYQLWLILIILVLDYVHNITYVSTETTAIYIYVVGFNHVNAYLVEIVLLMTQGQSSYNFQEMRQLLLC